MQKGGLAPQLSADAGNADSPPLDHAAETGVDAIQSADDSSAAGASFNNSGGVVVPRIKVPKGGTE